MTRHECSQKQDASKKQCGKEIRFEIDVVESLLPQDVEEGVHLCIFCSYHLSAHKDLLTCLSQCLPVHPPSNFFHTTGLKFIAIHIYEKGQQLEINLKIPEDEWFEELQTELEKFQVILQWIVIISFLRPSDLYTEILQRRTSHHVPSVCYGRKSAMKPYLTPRL